MPVRKIPKNYRSVTGRFASLKNNRNIAFESTLERDFFLTLEFDRQVKDYEEQPLTISDEVDGIFVRYTPDCLVRYFDGRQTLFEVKHVVDLEKDADDLKAKFFIAELYAKSRDMSFVVATELDIRGPRLYNQHFLYRFSTPPRSFDKHTTEIITTLGKGMTLNDLLIRISPDRTVQATRLPVIWHLVFAGLLQLNMDVPINNNSFLQVNHGSTISETRQ